MNREKIKVIGVVIQMPVDLAIEIVGESGNLIVLEYPAIEKLAECITEALYGEHLESNIDVEPIFVFERAGKMPIANAQKAQ